eukprot:3936085-Rhodomonas_salina.2
MPLTTSAQPVLCLVKPCDLLQQATRRPVTQGRDATRSLEAESLIPPSPLPHHGRAGERSRGGRHGAYVREEVGKGGRLEADEKMRKRGRVHSTDARRLSSVVRAVYSASVSHLPPAVLPSSPLPEHMHHVFLRRRAKATGIFLFVPSLKRHFAGSQLRVRGPLPLQAPCSSLSDPRSNCLASAKGAGRERDGRQG